jgi:16S rRNA (uracil1498-N3)-methyltransferase
MGGFRRKDMRRFLIGSGAPGDIVPLPEGEAQHARRVLRLRPGDRVRLMDGRGALYDAELVEVGDRVTARLGERLDGAAPPVALTLYQGLPKSDKLEFIAQKAAELGACRLVPVRMARSVVKLPEAEGARKRERAGEDRPRGDEAVRPRRRPRGSGAGGPWRRAFHVPRGGPDADALGGGAGAPPEG